MDGPIQDPETKVSWHVNLFKMFSLTLVPASEVNLVLHSLLHSTSKTSESSKLQNLWIFVDATGFSSALRKVQDEQSKAQIGAGCAQAAQGTSLRARPWPLALPGRRKDAPTSSLSPAALNRKTKKIRRT